MSTTASAAAYHANQAHARRNFWMALIANFFWINASEIWRFLVVIRPMLQSAYPGRSDIGPFTLPVFASWSVWDTVLILAATGFYWLYMNWSGRSVRHALVAATYFTVTIFGLIWLGVVNMGFVPASFIWAALPLAWVEQAVAALIVWWAMGKQRV
jgi:hypothetical protein